MWETDRPIAVVGMACRVPGAHDMEEFWANLVAGKESITFWSAEELRAAGVTEADLANPDYIRAAPMMPAADGFDAGLFRMTAREAELCDPQIRVFLELCHSAVEDAGYDPFDLADTVGVFGSAGPNNYLPQYLWRRPDLLGLDGTLVQSLNQPDYLSTLAAYKLNLRGPAMTVLTACSSSLVSIHLACQALRLGECDVAVVGASVLDLPLVRGRLWTPGGITTADGHCRPFDAGASGTIFGSGAGAVVLKRLEDALADRDRVRAVVRGSAVNNDGADKVSFGAPSVDGQVAAVIEAMTLAGVTPSDIGFVEGHATGTILGDPIEVAALAEAYAELAQGALEPGSVILGSVKSNVGHLGAASGVTSFIKTVLALDREAVPATVNLDRVNHRLELDKTPFRISTGVEPWPRDVTRPRMAAVTSLGVGGTNAHAVLEEGPVQAHRRPDGRPRVVLWSAATEPAVRAQRGRLAGFFGGCGEEVFPDAAATLQHGRTPHRCRAALVAGSAADAAALLAGSEPVVTGTAQTDGSVAYLLPGQGSLREGTARELYGTVRGFTVAMDECLELFEEHGVPLYRRWLGRGEERDDAGQALLFAVEYSLAEMWRQWGAPPAAVLGHSLGELSAAAIAGVFSLPDAIGLVVARAAAMAEHPVPGGMLAVAASADDVLPLLAEPLAVSAVNAPRETVVCGPADALSALAARLAERPVASRPLPVDAAFHHPGWERAERVWHESFGSVTFRAPRVPLYSSLTGDLAEPARLATPAFWTAMLTSPVRFHDALRALRTQWPGSTLLEVGPGGTLSSLARRGLANARGTVASTLGEDGPEPEAVLRTAARLWAAGCAIDWAAAEQPSPAVRVSVPGYPYERVRYWADPPQAETDVPKEEPALGPPSGPAVSEIHWAERTRPALPRHADGNALVLLPEDADDAARVLLAVQRAGWRPIQLRPGPSFAAVPGGFHVRPGRPDDLRKAYAALREAGSPLAVVVHALATGGPAPGGDDDAFVSLLTLCRLVVTSADGPAPPRLVLLTTGSVDVSGGDLVDPHRAALHGLFRTVRREAPDLHGAAIDYCARTDVPALAAELSPAVTDDVVALRGRRRWEPAERRLPLPAKAETPLRERGVYLITGGSGGLGLAVARELAGTGLRPTLILLSRRGPQAVAAGELERIRSLGATVIPYACDVTDGAALGRVVAEVAEHHGPVTGLFHLAGLPGARMVAFREAADALAVMAPKTAGTACLERVFAGQPPLDFAVFFSSLAAAEGLVGNGDYAAANAFLDAAAIGSSLADGRVLSIGWPIWRGRTMANRSGVDVADLNGAVRRRPPAARAGGETGLVWETEMSAATHWELDEHRVDGVPLLPGTAYLDLAVRAYREVAAPASGPIGLSDVVFTTPMFAQEPRVVRLTFRPVGDRFDVAVTSRPPGGDGSWTSHATAVIGPAEPRPGRVDLGELRRRHTAPAGPSRAEGGSLFTLGPHWWSVREVWSSGSDLLMRLELPPAHRSETARYALHPALLDSVTAAVSGPGTDSYVPFLYNRVVVAADIPAAFYAHVRRDPRAPHDSPSGDVDLIDEHGEVLVSVEKFVMIAGRDALQTALPSAARDSGKAGGVSEAGGETDTTDDGLDPAVAVCLMLRLIGSGVRGPVLVRPRP
ncbi:SDR family NAD(P)-dependent oxidoreductase, partial [Nonomuraea sp. KC401]|uniref:type I polyketide synthase n=3 Tax=unclassified Nonomuraea TaxID=2593643 RepID=UPI0010FCFA49